MRVGYTTNRIRYKPVKNSSVFGSHPLRMAGSGDPLHAPCAPPHAPRIPLDASPSRTSDPHFPRASVDVLPTANGALQTAQHSVLSGWNNILIAESALRAPPSVRAPVTFAPNTRLPTAPSPFVSPFASLASLHQPAPVFTERDLEPKPTVPDVNDDRLVAMEYELCAFCSARLIRFPLPHGRDVHATYCLCCRRPLPAAAFSSATRHHSSGRQCTACATTSPSRSLAAVSRIPTAARRASVVESAMERIVQDLNELCGIQLDPAAFSVEPWFHSLTTQLQQTTAMKKALQRRMLEQMRNDDTAAIEVDALFEEWVDLQRQRNDVFEQLAPLYRELMKHKKRFLPATVELALDLALAVPDPEHRVVCATCSGFVTRAPSADTLTCSTSDYCDCCLRVLPSSVLLPDTVNGGMPLCRPCYMTDRPLVARLRLVTRRQERQAIVQLVQDLGHLRNFVGSLEREYGATNAEARQPLEVAVRSLKDRSVRLLACEKAILSEGSASVRLSQLIYLELAALDRECEAPMKSLARDLLQTVKQRAKQIPAPLGDLFQRLAFTVRFNDPTVFTGIASAESSNQTRRCPSCGATPFTTTDERSTHRAMVKCGCCQRKMPLSMFSRSPFCVACKLAREQHQAALDAQLASVSSKSKKKKKLTQQKAAVVATIPNRKETLKPSQAQMASNGRSDTPQRKEQHRAAPSDDKEKRTSNSEPHRSVSHTKLSDASRTRKPDDRYGSQPYSPDRSREQPHKRPNVTSTGYRSRESKSSRSRDRHESRQSKDKRRDRSRDRHESRQYNDKDRGRNRDSRSSGSRDRSESRKSIVKDRSCTHSPKKESASGDYRSNQKYTYQSDHRRDRENTSSRERQSASSYSREARDEKLSRDKERSPRRGESRSVRDSPHRQPRRTDNRRSRSRARSPKRPKRS